MPYRSTRNNMLAGVFVLASVALAAVVVVTLAGVADRLEPMKRYIVRFSLADGVPGLDEGSEVTLAGRPCGRVTRIKITDFEGDGAPDSVDVFVRIRSSIPLYSDAAAYLERQLLGTTSTLNLPGVGGAEGSTKLTRGGIIPGRMAVPSILSQAGYGAEQRSQLRSILTRVDKLTERFTGIADRLDSDVADQLKAMLDDFHKLANELQTRSPAWFDHADTITENFASASTRVNDASDEAQRLINELSSLLNDNRQKLANSIDNLESASGKADALMDRVNNETIELVNNLLEDGRTGVAHAQSAIDRVDTLLAEETPNLRKTIANARLSSDQFRLTMGEVRRSPWRLLYKPNKKELEFELLYDSARSYAVAVSDLRAAVESLESVTQGDGSRLSTQGQPLSEYVDEVRAAFESYKGAEEKFLDLLIKGSP